MAIRNKFICSGLFWICSCVCYGGEAGIVNAEVECSHKLCRFRVTMQHEDEGWEHYVNRFEILNLEKNKILGFRKLQHPHVKEQPFTRSASVLFDELPSAVVIRAYDSIHEYGGKEIILAIPHSEP